MCSTFSAYRQHFLQQPCYTAPSTRAEGWLMRGMTLQLNFGLQLSGGSLLSEHSLAVLLSALHQSC